MRHRGFRPCLRTAELPKNSPVSEVEICSASRQGGTTRDGYAAEDSRATIPDRAKPAPRFKPAHYPAPKYSRHLTYHAVGCSIWAKEDWALFGLFAPPIAARGISIVCRMSYKPFRAGSACRSRATIEPDLACAERSRSMIKSLGVVLGSYVLSIVLVLSSDPLLSLIFPGQYGANSSGQSPDGEHSVLRGDLDSLRLGMWEVRFPPRRQARAGVFHYRRGHGNPYHHSKLEQRLAPLVLSIVVVELAGQLLHRTSALGSSLG